MEIGTCSACHTVNVPGTLLCENCGTALVTIAVNQTTSKIPDAALRAATASAAANSSIAAQLESAPTEDVREEEDQVERIAPTVADPPAATVAAAAATGTGETSQTTGEAATALMDAPGSPGSAVEPAASAPLAAPLVEAYLIAEDGYRVDIPARDVIVVGREDARQGVRPDVDLNPAGGSAAGVSRRHCRLLRGSGASAGSTGPFSWQGEDLRSTNYTTLNGRVLQAHMPVPLRDGDKLRLGKLRLQFHTS